ncbi:hypothetical protein LIA77_06241 [Sarocladium implicatum]|nr:hypothetical protein LIA77_06241 [Sarocladium implicatum]
MAARAAMRFVARSSESSVGSLHLRLLVKPGASKVREGITAITDSAIELCVAAQPRDGEANKAVIELLSDALEVPKSRLKLGQGGKSRHKTAVLDGVHAHEADLYAQTLRAKAKA